MTSHGDGRTFRSKSQDFKNISYISYIYIYIYIYIHVVIVWQITLKVSLPYFLCVSAAACLTLHQCWKQKHSRGGGGGGRGGGGSDGNILIIVVGPCTDTKQLLLQLRRHSCSHHGSSTCECESAACSRYTQGCGTLSPPLNMPRPSHKHRPPRYATLT
ncbi:hypothetical protein JOB18_044066 [Solea senegalensis]|uniref:Uncharacterized protein n=1 Tax=Solea senegalensis TaxID=28829 RepID=A0AAV6PPC2_SOLSE|nr:hypothetical protein JOB18_044066 [Solea senegalensis]